MRHTNINKRRREPSWKKAPAVDYRAAPPPTTYWPTHQRLNAAAAVFHGALALVCVAMITTLPTGFELHFARMWSTNITFPPCFNTTSCGGVDYKDRSVYDWLDCVRDNVTDWRKANDAADIDVFQPQKERVWSLPVAWLLLAFECLTCCSHVWLVVDDVGYQWRLNRMLQPWRWLEYSLTASIMLLMVLSLSKVEDMFLLTSLFVNSFFLNFVGGTLFELLYYAERQLSETKTQTQTGGVQEWMRWMKWTAFAASWLAYATNIWTIWDSYTAIVKPYIDHPVVGAFFAQLFDPITWAIVGITVSFSVFPILHGYSFWPWRPDDERVAAYRFGEKLFIMASFVSKAVLVLTIGVPAFMRPKTE